MHKRTYNTDSPIIIVFAHAVRSYRSHLHAPTMGVPFFFGKLRQARKDIVITDRQVKLDWVFTDTNGLIHPICRRVMSEHPELAHDHKELEWLMCKMIVEKLRDIVTTTGAQHLSIKIDGPCPFAKIKQQRIRRFKGMADRQLENTIRAKWNLPAIEPIWDSCAITPGTEFMRRLSRLITIKIRKNYFGATVDFSSSDEPGEGEHKILKHIRRLLATAKRTGTTTPTIGVHGLDADLIFLMMSSECPRIYLMREMEEIDRDQRGNTTLAYVDMDRLTGYVLETIVPPPNSQPINCIRDWIAFCYFLGNDFLPSFPSLSVKNDGLEQLVTCYNQIGRQLVVCEGDQWSLDTQTLSTLAAMLAHREVSAISRYRRRQRHTPTYRSFEHEWDGLQRMAVPTHDAVQVGEGTETQWKYRYYQHFFKTDSMAQVYAMCRKYHEGLIWVTNYYFGTCPSWTWFYPGDYAPCISDFAKAEFDSDIEFTSGVPTTPEHQLLLCLPITSQQLMPERFRHLVSPDTGALADLYPRRCEEDLMWKTHLWQGIPRLPAFDPVRVLSAARAVDAD